MNEPNTPQKSTMVSPQQKLNARPPRDPAQDTRLENIIGFIQIVTVAPTGLPKTFWDSIKIFNDSGTFYLYVYAESIGWKYTALT